MRGDAFFADFFRLYPVHATDAGNHEHDGRWMDLTESGTAQRLAWLAEVRARLDLHAQGLPSKPGAQVERQRGILLIVSVALAAGAVALLRAVEPAPGTSGAWRLRAP